MKAIYVKNYGFWSVVLLVGIVLVAAGLFQMSDFRGGDTGVGEPPPAAGESVGTGALAEEKKSPSPPKTGNIFVEYRLERDRMRSQRIELLRELVNNPHTSEQDRSEAQRMLMAISQAMETEMRLENLIRAENFKDVVAFVQDNSATVIVQAPMLTAPDKAKLTEITARVTGVKPENIIIIVPK